MRMAMIGLGATAAALALGGVALTACKKEVVTNEKTEVKSAPAAVADMPKRKPGLWQQVVTVEGAAGGMTTKVCLDAASDAKLSIQGQQIAGAACSEQTMTKAPDGSYKFSSTCSMGTGGTTKSTGSAAGDFNSAYTVTANAETTGAAAPQMNRAMKMAVAAKWLGPCPAGWIPGDIELPGGTRVNTVAAAEAAPAPAK